MHKSDREGGRYAGAKCDTGLEHIALADEACACLVGTKKGRLESLPFAYFPTTKVGV
jgi:hypothetical protein